MVLSDTPELLHIVGYLTGASLYAMLLVMVLRTKGPIYRLTLGTAVLGLAWNVGELAAHGFESLRMPLAAEWMAAVSYVALGLLAAVVIDSATHVEGHGGRPARRRLLARAGYACAAVAGAMQLVAAAYHWPLPWSTALVLLTTGFALLSPALLLTTRRQPQGRRALWMTALALFAVSALHLGRTHGATESWPMELLGHHASIPLAFAILYQDYRFAFADLFLKRALTLLALVTIVLIGWSLVASSFVPASPGSPAVALLLALWIGTALVLPWIGRQASMLVDRVILKRENYATLADEIAALVERCASEDAVLDRVCDRLGPALSADAVTWRADGTPENTAGPTIEIPTTEAPRHALTIGRFAGGRQLLSDDQMMLERVALLAGRRIDALRLGEERYKRMLREREMRTLATEAELRALRAQINPHFLFNTLTTLGYLIQSAPTRALDTLMRLTTLLRSVLRSDGALTTLGHERELIACYLEIERERFEERLDARVDIPDALTHVAIPALIVQPLVENAIKHGIAHARAGGRVIVSARLQSGGSEPALHIVVRNTGAPLMGRSPAAEEGIGLRNVERRLRGYYGDGAAFTLSSAESGETVAELRLPATGVTEQPAEVPVERRRG